MNALQTSSPRCWREQDYGCTAPRPGPITSVLTPGGMRRELSVAKAEALLARIRPGDDVARVRLQIARDHLADIRAVDARLKAIGATSPRRPNRTVSSASEPQYRRSRRQYFTARHDVGVAAEQIVALARRRASSPPLTEGRSPGRRAVNFSPESGICLRRGATSTKLTSVNAHGRRDR